MQNRSLAGDGIARDNLRQLLMERDKLREREEFYITAADLASSDIKTESVKKAVAEEVNMVVDIFFYLMKRGEQTS